MFKILPGQSGFSYLDERTDQNRPAYDPQDLESEVIMHWLFTEGWIHPEMETELYEPVTMLINEHEMQVIKAAGVDPMSLGFRVEVTPSANPYTARIEGMQVFGRQISSYAGRLEDVLIEQPPFGEKIKRKPIQFNTPVTEQRRPKRVPKK